MTGGGDASQHGASSVLVATGKVVSLPPLKHALGEAQSFAALKEQSAVDVGGYENFLRGLSGRTPQVPYGLRPGGGRARVSLMQTRAGVIREARASLEKRSGVVGASSPTGSAGILELAKDLTSERSPGGASGLGQAKCRQRAAVSASAPSKEPGPSQLTPTFSRADVVDLQSARNKCKPMDLHLSSPHASPPLQMARGQLSPELGDRLRLPALPTNSASPSSEHRSAPQRFAANCAESPDNACGTSIADQCRLRHQREACESLRVLFFGRIGNENWPEKDKDFVFEQRRGTDTEMHIFAETYDAMDADHSGDIDFAEFLAFFADRKADVLLGMRIVRYLLSVPVQESEQDGEDKALGRKSARGSGHSASRRQPTRSACSREDVMRLVWLKATDEDVKAMEMAFHFLKLRQFQAETPPLIPRRRQKELVDNFQHLDGTRSGRISYSDLVDAGLGNRETVAELQKKHDLAGNGTLDCREFVQMFCPHGFRADEDVKQAVMQGGQSMSIVTCEVGRYSFEGWLMDQDATEFRESVPEMPLHTLSGFGQQVIEAASVY